MYSSRPKFIILMALAREATCCEKAIVLHSTMAAMVSILFILF
jgi:hypothetical protein